MGDTQRGGQKNRKYGRAGRRPSHNSYNAQERWKTNKARTIAIQKRLEAKKRAKKSSGTA